MKKLKVLLLSLVSLVFLASCSLPGLPSNKDDNVIGISGGVTTESQILASLTDEMIRHYTDKKTSVINNLGTATINQQALERKDIDLAAARYTGTDITTILQMDAIKDPQKAYEVDRRESKKRFDQKVYPSFGFSNAFVFLVRKDTAEKYHLKKVSDLKSISDQLTVGTDRPWLTRKGDGYPGFIKEYGFEFKKMLPMQIGLVYDAVAAHKVDVVLGYSTDGRIISNNLVALEDDHHFFPPYDAVIIANQNILDQDPEVDQALARLEDTISTETMQRLNYEADNNLIEPSIVAKNFLEKNHYFEDK